MLRRCSFRLLAAAAALAALVALGGGVATAAPTDPRLEGVSSWAFAIGSGTLRGDLAARYGGYDLVVVDAQEAGRRHLRTLQEDGTAVLGYLSVGTIERYRPWYTRLKPYRLQAWKDWKGEFFADVSRRGFRHQIARRIAPKLLAKGFDGLFLDNVDMIENHKRQARGMRKLVAQLGRLVDAEGSLLFAQNGYSVLDRFLPHLDGWNREDVSTYYDFDRDRYRWKGAASRNRAMKEIRKVAKASLLVTATDYTRRRGGARVKAALERACTAGALPFVSDIELRRIPRRAHRCG